MADYQKMYYTLFHAVEEAIQKLECFVYEKEQILNLLTSAQQLCEEIYIDSEEHTP